MRRRGRPFRAVLALSAAASIATTSGAATNGVLRGADSFAGFQGELLALCPAASGLGYRSVSNAASAAALAAGEQELAPMGRALTPREACATPAPSQIDAALVALDAATLYSDAGHASCGAMGLMSAGCFEVRDLDGVPGVDCPACEPGTQTYCLKDTFGQPGTVWRDVLRLVFAGMSHDAGHELAGQSCGGDLRRTLVDTWHRIFAFDCAPGLCTRLERAYRPPDGSASLETFLALLDLPPSEQRPFCNGAGNADADPIRRTCPAEELVCQNNHTLGLVVPVVTPEVTTATAYPTAPCGLGRFGLRPALRTPLPGGLVQYTCPERTDYNVAGNCIAPLTLSGSAACLSAANNRHVLMPAGTDGRTFNRWLRTTGGALVLNGDGSPVTAAFYRTRTSSCAHGGALDQAACLATSTPCSVGLSNRQALGRLPGTHAFAVRGVAPTDLDVRRLLAVPADPAAYPLAFRILVSARNGMGAVVDPLEAALADCSVDPSLAPAAAEEAGLVPLDHAPSCVDFNEATCNAIACSSHADCTGLGQCIAGRCAHPCATDADCPDGRTCQPDGGCEYLGNTNRCVGDVVFTFDPDLCPVLSVVSAAPTSAPVGGSLAVNASASDAEGDPLTYTWTAASGSFATPGARNTTYTCAEAGIHVLTVTVFDGQCSDAHSFAITCT